MRVRMVRGCGLALSFGKLPGSMCSKYMLVDGEKVMFGSYRSEFMFIYHLSFFFFNLKKIEFN